YRNNPQEFAKKNLKIMESSNQLLDFQPFRMTRTSKASKRISRSKRSKIIISASGMCDGGRIQYHLRDNLWRKKSSIIFVGYQAEGTIGKKLISGEKILDIMEEMVDVKAEIYYLDGFSSHADKDELIWWLKGFQNKPAKVFIVHGEKSESETMAENVNEQLSYDTYIPAIGETFLIQENHIVTQGLLRDENKVLQLDEIVREVRKIRHKFNLLLADMEISGVDLKEENLCYKIKQQLEQIQQDIKKVKYLIKENELEV
ncbi:MAG: MBL fold metallo-hydrolase, partial [Atribacterota bacterium]|nr:MBL fold metallo-hydrolase [Atribacterota bacterium]